MVTRPVDTSTEPTLDGAPGGGPRPGRRASWRRPQWPQGLAAVVAVGALAPAVLGLAWVVSQSVSSPLRADAPPEPLVVPVAAVARDQPVSVLLTVEHSAPFQAVVAGGGVVTDLHVGAGDEVEPGDRLVSIDDQVRVAFTAPAPLWRDIGLGAEGEDVDRVRDFLAALDLPAGTVPGRATAATVEGIRQLNQSLGRGSGDRVLRRETLLWIGPGPMPVSRVLVEVGDVVAAGQAVLEGPSRPAAVTVETAQPHRWPEAELVLRVGDVEVPFDPQTGRVDDPESVAAIAEILGGDEGGGTVRLAAPEEVGTLPASAVVTDAAGRTCVFESVSAPPTPIEVAGGSLSMVEVPVDWVGRPVLANPREVREDLSCG